MRHERLVHPEYESNPPRRSLRVPEQGDCFEEGGTRELMGADGNVKERQRSRVPRLDREPRYVVTATASSVVGMVPSQSILFGSGAVGVRGTTSDNFRKANGAEAPTFIARNGLSSVPYRECANTSTPPRMTMNNVTPQYILDLVQCGYSCGRW